MCEPSQEWHDFTFDWLIKWRENPLIYLKANIVWCCRNCVPVACVASVSDRVIERILWIPLFRSLSIFIDEVARKRLVRRPVFMYIYGFYLFGKESLIFENLI